MSKATLKVNYSQVGALLRGQETKSMLQDLGSRIASRCGEGYATSSKTLGTRAIGSVYATTKKAIKDNMQNNTLLKGLKG